MRGHRPKGSREGYAPRVVWLLIALLAPALPAHAEEESAQPKPPYYASFRSNEVNMRVGPSKDHPISWVYRRGGLPVQVIDIHNEWRYVRDPYGDKGWVKKTLLSPRRTLVTVPKLTAMRSHPSVNAAVEAQVEGGVVCKLVSCNQHWCQADAGTHRGWLEKTALWGVDPAEIIE